MIIKQSFFWIIYQFPVYQFDNAQRIEEKGFGMVLNGFYDLKEDFEKAIEFCSSEEVKKRCKKMSERMKRDNNLKGACELIVNLIK